MLETRHAGPPRSKSRSAHEKASIYTRIAELYLEDDDAVPRAAGSTLPQLIVGYFDTYRRLAILILFLNCF